MTVHDLLAGSGLTRLDAEVLLSSVLRKDRAWLSSHGSDDIDAVAARAFEDFVKRRNAGEPVAYIVGKKEFYGRDFAVRPGVLIPRPCTEALVDAALRLLDGGTVEPVKDIDEGIVCAAATTGACAGLATVVDVGTGSGCLAITLACERPGLRCVAIDVSADALDVARENAEKLGVADRIEWKHGSALEPLGDGMGAFLLVTNPPYVTNIQLLADDVLMHEPPEALLGGGRDGGDTLRDIVRQAKALDACRGIVAECLREQAPIVVSRRAPRPT